MTAPLPFFNPTNPIHGISPELKAEIARAQTNLLHIEFPTVGDLIAKVFRDLKLDLALPPKGAAAPVQVIADVSFRDLTQYFEGLLSSQGFAPTMLLAQAKTCAGQLQIVRAFDNPTSVMARIEKKVEEAVAAFPKTAEDIECGTNPGDVIDPFILSASELLMCEGSFDDAIAVAVGHKGSMMIEGLMGHLHEDVIGMMRGNVRIPEPKGEDLHPINNPFPGADVLQPPFQAGQKIRFHQVKNKTGSNKGGDGKRLGLQLDALRSLYDAEIFYDALIGRTLKGHRSRGAVEEHAPGVTVLVGDAAFRELTRSAIGPELLLRMYQTVFSTVAAKTGYSLKAVTATVVKDFAERAAAHGEGLLESILSDVISGPPEDQDNRVYVKRRGKRGK